MPVRQAGHLGALRVLVVVIITVVVLSGPDLSAEGPRAACRMEECLELAPSTRRQGFLALGPLCQVS